MTHTTSNRNSAVIYTQIERLSPSGRSQSVNTRLREKVVEVPSMDFAATIADTHGQSTVSSSLRRSMTSLIMPIMYGVAVRCAQAMLPENKGGSKRRIH